MKRRWLMLLLFVVAAAGGALLYAWSGFYNVAASAGHWNVTRWLLEFTMANSVERHAHGIDAPSLDDPALILRGAGHYQGGCAPCHGAPGEARNPIVQHMLPPPPYLVEKVSAWNSDELFWIVKHGLKYTGMPAWVAPQREDEVWAVVAFLRRLPQLSEADYQNLARGDSARFDRRNADNTRLLALAGTIGQSLSACVRCHGLDGSGRNIGAFPRLAGQSAPYLYESLKSYATGVRASGMMQPVAAALTDGQMQALADFYARLTDAPYPASASAGAIDPRLLQLGGEIMIAGAPDQGVPACASCHGIAGAPPNPLYPRLAGQYADYLALQLRLFKEGVRRGTEYAEIMATVAQRLTDEQIRAVSLYYASLRPGGAPGDEARPPSKR